MVQRNRIGLGGADPLAYRRVSSFGWHYLYQFCLPLRNLFKILYVGSFIDNFHSMFTVGM